MQEIINDIGKEQTSYALQYTVFQGWLAVQDLALKD